MKLEKFEQEYSEQIQALKSVEFKTVEAKPFSFPSYKVFYSKAISIAFALPAFTFIFAMFLYTGNQTTNTDLAMLEASNNRILDEINSLDNNQ